MTLTAARSGSQSFWNDAMDASASSTQLFRDGMSRLGASVNVVTSDGGSGRLGFTATSVCSLSDNPPSLLVCMNRSSTQNAALKANGVLRVNILAPEHRDLSAAFAGVGRLDSESRFKMAAWTALRTGAPVLKGAIASFDCKIAQALEVNTHTILICDVVGVQANDGDSSLIYFKRGYRDLVPPGADAGR